MKGKFVYKIKLDTSDRYKKSVILLRDGELIDEIKGDLDVVVAIQAILQKNKIKISEIDEFYANPGPGSFTGLKIGATIANVLNWVSGKKKIDELSYPEYGSEPNIHKTEWLEK